jgi:hypothetical protein
VKRDGAAAKKSGRSNGIGAGKFHQNVSVILLDSKVAKHPAISRVNRKRDAKKPCVYVGMSGLPPEHRFYAELAGQECEQRRCLKRLPDSLRLRLPLICHGFR